MIKDVRVISTVELLLTTPLDVLQNFAIGSYFNCSRTKLTYISLSLYTWAVIPVHSNLLQNEKKLFIIQKRWPWVFQEIAHNGVFQQTTIFINIIPANSIVTNSSTPPNQHKNKTKQRNINELSKIFKILKKLDEETLTCPSVVPRVMIVALLIGIASLV